MYTIHYTDYALVESLKRRRSGLEKHTTRNCQHLQCESIFSFLVNLC